MSSYPEDDQLIRQLAAGDEGAWRRLYDDMRSPFRLFFIRYGAMAPEDALNLFQEAMVVLHRNCTGGKIQPPLTSSIKTYLFGIGKILLKKNGVDTRHWDDDIPELPVAPEVESREDQRANAELVRRLLDKIGEPCKRLLELIFVHGYVMDAVAEELELPSAGAARKRKFDCLKKMRDLIVFKT
ncbi:MAG: sigma-70 family RNA polymerase sigma factor [Lewinellaceae bacterium]|nr:sigma-70 family RNA polymerase sigma factor [Lewinellaceae bacterium]